MFTEEIFTAEGLLEANLTGDFFTGEILLVNFGLIDMDSRIGHPGYVTASRH